MEKHIQVVGILNITYRAMLLLASFILVALAACFGRFMEMLMRMGELNARDIPYEILDIIPVILVVVAIAMFVVSVAGIVAGIGVLRKKPWGRVLMLVISFINLLRIPLGTALGAYSIWVLLNDETIRLFKTPG
ncbi:MAG TPA: hypothetical protein VMM80_03160 [Bacteroidota bacterium]|nr:hypothetical protein [Bacteroidota bacterium]